MNIKQNYIIHKIKLWWVKIAVLFVTIFVLSYLSSLNKCEAKQSINIFPFRFVAIADVIDLSNGSYAVYEFLDIYNDDYNRNLIVFSVKADTWVGRRVVSIQEEWLTNSANLQFSGQENTIAELTNISNSARNIASNQTVTPLIIPPLTKVRAVQRQRVVTGYPLRNWWVRWLRFTIYTNFGTFRSNFISSPMKPPTVIVSERLGNQIDDWSAPPGHTKAPKTFKEPWKIYPFSDTINLRDSNTLKK